MYDALSSDLCSIQTVSDRQRKHPSHEKKAMILSMSTSNLIVMVYYTILYYSINTSFSSMIIYIYTHHNYGTIFIIPWYNKWRWYKLIYHQHAQQKLLEDRKFEAGEAIAPKLLLHLMATAGADRFVTIDLHNQAPGHSHGDTRAQGPGIESVC